MKRCREKCENCREKKYNRPISIRPSFYLSFSPSFYASPLLSATAVTGPDSAHLSARPFALLSARAPLHRITAGSDRGAGRLMGALRDYYTHRPPLLLHVREAVFVSSMEKCLSTVWRKRKNVELGLGSIKGRTSMEEEQGGRQQKMGAAGFLFVKSNSRFGSASSWGQFFRAFRHRILF